MSFNVRNTFPGRGGTAATPGESSIKLLWRKGILQGLQVGANSLLIYAFAFFEIANKVSHNKYLLEH